MNPRYRRLLIPGLLVVLIVVVLVSSLAHAAKGATGAAVGVTPAHPVVSRVDDARITELSGMALSRRHPGIAYVINDSGNAPVVYAIRVATGAVVGTTALRGGAFADTEAIALDAHGNLWIADTGDNEQDRTDAALYEIPEPGTRTSTVTAVRFPIRYADRTPDVEALAIDPRTDAKYLISKSIADGTMYDVPATLSRTTPTLLRPRPSAPSFPLLVTDAAFTPDGTYLLTRTYIAVQVYRFPDLKLVQTVPMDVQPQGEAIAVEPSGRSYLLGTEGRDSTIMRVGFDPPAEAVAAPQKRVQKQAASVDHASSPWSRPAQIAVGGAAVLLAVGVVTGGVMLARRAIR